MKFIMMKTACAIGCYLPHHLAIGSKTIKKSTKLTKDDIKEILDSGLEEVYVGQLADDELDENEAANLIAPYMANHFTTSVSTTGRVNFFTPFDGLFKVNSKFVHLFNAIDSAITLATIAADSAVFNSEIVATLKIIPISVNKEKVAKIIEFIENRILFDCQPFIPHEVTLFETILPNTKSSTLNKTANVLKQRLANYASRLKDVIVLNHDHSELALNLKKYAKRASKVKEKQIFIIYGASATIDENDVIPLAINEAGGHVIRIGMPVEPGNLIIMGQIDNIVLIGAPGCSRSVTFNGLDLVFHHILTGKLLSSLQISRMGVGGLIRGQMVQLSIKEKTTQVNINVSAIILAAGSSTRMKQPHHHKLLAKMNGEPLIHKVVVAALNSQCKEVKLITGHRNQDIENAVSDIVIESIYNPLFTTGMASSIIAGFQAINTKDNDGILILLGDMPAITTAMIDEMIAAFIKYEGQAIIRAVFNGKRGNPVIVPNTLRRELVQLQGDIGARAIIEQSNLNIIDIDIGEAAHIDLDTPEAMAKMGAIFDN